MPRHYLVIGADNTYKRSCLLLLCKSQGVVETAVRSVVCSVNYSILNHIGSPQSVIDELILVAPAVKLSYFLADLLRRML